MTVHGLGQAMYWVLEAATRYEQGFVDLLEALERRDLPHSIHQVENGVLVPEIEPPNPTMAMGTYALSGLAGGRAWRPGVISLAGFDFTVQRLHWGDAMLNADATVLPLGEISPPSGAFFVRPLEDTKSFNGKVMDRARFDALRSALSGPQANPRAATLATPVIVAPVKTILREYRLWIVEGAVVTCSLYKIGGQGRAELVRDDPVLRIGAELAARWSPVAAYVLDIADTPAGYRVVEINSINSAGFYEADVGRLVDALEAAFD